MQDCVDAGQISSAQLEVVIYANDRFNLRLPAPAHLDLARESNICMTQCICAQIWCACLTCRCFTCLQPATTASYSHWHLTCRAACLAALTLHSAAAPRAGFALGDGAGVGKGRQIAATILVRTCLDSCRRRPKLPCSHLRAILLSCSSCWHPTCCSQCGQHAPAHLPACCRTTGGRATGASCGSRCQQT